MRPTTYLACAPQCLCEVPTANARLAMPGSYPASYSWAFLIGPYSCSNNCCQDSQSFVVTSQGLLLAILSSTKHRDSQQGDLASSTVKRLKTACVGDNSITQTTHKTKHSTSLHVMKLSRLSPCFWYSMRQKAGEESGNEAM